MGPHLILGSEARHDQQALVGAGACKSRTCGVIVGYDPGLRRFRSGIDLVRTSESKVTGGHPECCSEKTASFESGTGVGRSSRSARPPPRSTLERIAAF